MSTTNSKRSKKSTQAGQSVEQLRVENEQLRARVNELEGIGRARERMVDNYISFFELLLKNDPESVVSRNAPEVVMVQKIIDDNFKNLSSLASGRSKGAAQNANIAAKLHDDWRRIASDLRKHQAKQHLTLDQQVEYIQMNEVGKMKDGKPYSVRKIRKALKGAK